MSFALLIWVSSIATIMSPVFIPAFSATLSSGNPTTCTFPFFFLEYRHDFWSRRDCYRARKENKVSGSLFLSGRHQE
jgi:hypothetical protein